MAEVKFINYEGKQILLMDFTLVTNLDLLNKLTDDSIELVRTVKDQHSILAILDLTNTQINQKVISSLKRLSHSNKMYMKFIIFVGLNKIWSFALKTLLLIAKKSNHKVINERSRALEWLVSQ